YYYLSGVEIAGVLDSILEERGTVVSKGKYFVTGTWLLVAMPLCVLLAAGCSKPAETEDSSSASSSDKPPGGPGKPGGMPGGGRGKGPVGPVAANASGAEIYQQKCQFCHGKQGS